MTPAELIRATWIPHPPPADCSHEIMAPWGATGCTLTAVEYEGDVYVVGRNRQDKIVESWKVLR